MTIRNRYLAAVNDKPWWLAGGIPQSACVAAYQAKGASSLAGSYINLANPGVYNAAAGANAPTWDVINGWYFSANRHLTTGIVPNGGNYSAVVRFTGTTVNAANRLFGSETGAAPRFFIIPNYNSDHYYANGATANGGDGIEAGVMAIAGKYGYLNGINDLTMADWSGTLAYDIYIGAENDDGSAVRYITAYIQAFSVYSAVITGDQVTALTNAMNAL